MLLEFANDVTMNLKIVLVITVQLNAQLNLIEISWHSNVVNYEIHIVDILSLISI